MGGYSEGVDPRLRCGEDVGRGAIRDDGAIEKHEAVARVGSLGQIMRRYEDGRSRLGEFLKEREERLGIRSVEAGKRLVEKEDIGTRGESTRDEHALALSAGELLDGTAGKLRETYQRDCFLCRAMVDASKPAEPARAAARDTVGDGDGKIPRNVVALGNVTQRGARGDGTGIAHETEY